MSLAVDCGGSLLGEGAGLPPEGSVVDPPDGVLARPAPMWSRNVVGQRGKQTDRAGTGVVIRRLHGLVTQGPWDLDIASAMSVYGYDEVKWAEGQAMLAELINDDMPARGTVNAAVTWYEGAAEAARHALSARPQLLAKLGLFQE